MKYILALAFFFLQISCVSSQKRMTFEEVKSSVLKTVADRMEDCGDTICEGDTDPESVIHATGQSIIWDLEDLYGE